jgi:hypothetical protein
MKNAAIWLICGLISVGIGAANIWIGIFCVPIMYGIAQSLTE